MQSSECLIAGFPVPRLRQKHQCRTRAIKRYQTRESVVQQCSPPKMQKGSPCRMLCEKKTNPTSPELNQEPFLATLGKPFLIELSLFTETDSWQGLYPWNESKTPRPDAKSKRFALTERLSHEFSRVPPMILSCRVCF